MTAEKANLAVGFMNVLMASAHTRCETDTCPLADERCLVDYFCEAAICAGTTSLVGFATTNVLFASSAGTLAPEW